MVSIMSYRGTLNTNPGRPHGLLRTSWPHLQLLIMQARNAALYRILVSFSMEAQLMHQLVDELLMSTRETLQQ